MPVDPLARFGRLVVGNLAHRAARIMQGGLEEQEAIALLGLHLTPCQWNILSLLLAHPLLADEEYEKEVKGFLCSQATRNFPLFSS